MRFTHFRLIVALSIISLPVIGQNPLWRKIDETSLTNRSEKRNIIPSKYQTFELNVEGMNAYLKDVPPRFNEENATKTVELPMSDGNFKRFAITESSVLPPRLASNYPTIHTFVGKGIDEPNEIAYLDITPKGFHGMILKAGQVSFIDPYFDEDDSKYLVYEKSDFFSENMDLVSCGNNDAMENILLSSNHSGDDFDRLTGVMFRTYNIAIAASGEYTQFQGGTVGNALAAIVTAINRVNAIYETDLAISFQLNNDETLIIYTNPNTDPYSYPPTLDENQANIDAVIGNSNYDIGHVLGTDFGGIATVGATCVNSVKARGMTSLDTPVGDPFYIDFLCHEIGHQFGAHHTFNGNEYSCGSAGTSINSAFEPGSGSTIMAYAGTCGSQNLQLNSHAYFHRRSLDEITYFVNKSYGHSCPDSVLTTNIVPTIDADPYGMNGKYIPINTPFELTAVGSDDEELTYTWEQMDLGATGAPSPSAPGPIIRSFPPTASPTRTIPALNALLDNTFNYAEYLPSISRTLKFKATARDNRTDGGANAADSIMLNVTNSAGPFQITNLNATAVVSGAVQVQWNVANTDNAPINCAEVDILLSVDGGQTYSPLLTNTPNDGSEIVTLPNTATGQARIKVKCSDNVFFDINNADLRIAPSDAVCSEKVVSGDFSSSTGWNEYSTNFGYVIDNWGIYHKADGSAWLGYADNETSYISQSVAIPSSAHFANLEFWYKLEAADCGNDIFKVYLDGAVAKTYTLCNDPASSNWVRQLINLSGKIGQTVVIKFELINNSSAPSDVLIDDVSVFTCENGAFSFLPVELMRFEAKAVENTAKLNWVTASETNNIGYDVQIQQQDGAFKTIGFVAGNGTTIKESHYNYDVLNLRPGVYYFRLSQKDDNGKETMSPIRSVLITDDTRVTISPNPVVDIAIFKVALDKPAYVQLQVLDGLGRVVGTVADNSFTDGNFDFAFNTSALPAGIYFYRMLGENIEEAGRFVVSK